MALAQKTIKKLNVGNFLTFLKDADTGKNQHVLDIKDGKIYTKITNESKEFVKFASADLAGIGGDWSAFNGEAFRFYMLDMKKLIDAFEIARTLRKEEVDVKVACIKMEEDGYTRIEKMWIEGQFKLQISARDGSFAFNYIKDESWAAMLAAPTIAEFDLDNEDITSLKKIFNYLTNEDNKSGKEQGLHIHFNTNDKGQPSMLFTEEDVKVFHLTHEKNVVYHEGLNIKHATFHSYIIPMLDQHFYRVHVKYFGESHILVAMPSGDAPRTFLIPLAKLA